MVTASANKLLKSIERSQLLDPQQLQRATESLRAEHGGELPDDPRRVAEWFQQQQLLSPWQAEKLLAGKSRGFFLGKYKLLSHLGRGGMGNVYLAIHQGMQRKVAIKVLPSELVDDRSYLLRFQREARVVAALDHTNIVSAYDFDHTGDVHYLVMEYVDGQDLAAIVKGSHRPLPIEQVTHYVVQAALGLQHAHDQGIVHRDVKPSNLLVDRSGCVKLLDLGLARLAECEGSSVTLANNESVLGTADYLSPEQAIDSHNADRRADIYSLGCTLFFALAGRPPFHEGTIAQRIAQHQSAPPPRLENVRPDVPPPLADICAGMIQKKPEDRYDSAREVAELLTAFLAQYEPPSSCPPTNSQLGDAQRTGTKRRHQFMAF